MPDEIWVLEYRRKVLDYLKAPQDIDLSTVRVEPSYEEVDDYEWVETDEGAEEHSVERRFFEIVVTWLYYIPRQDGQRSEPGVPGEEPLYEHRQTLVNHEAVKLLQRLDPQG